MLLLLTMRLKCYTKVAKLRSYILKSAKAKLLTYKPNFKGAMCCLQAKPYKYTCYSCQAAVTCALANGLFHVLGKDYFMLHKILCGSITANNPFNASCMQS